MKHQVTPNEEGMRLRDVLRQSMGMSYTAMKSAKWDGRILVNQSPRTVDQPVHVGEWIEVLDKEALPVYSLTPCYHPVSIAYEDDDLWIIDKPAPWPVSPASVRVMTP